MLPPGCLEKLKQMLVAQGPSLQKKKRKSRAESVKIVPQALNSVLQYEGHLCCYKRYFFFHKSEINYSPDKTVLCLKTKQSKLTKMLSHERYTRGARGGVQEAKAMDTDRPELRHWS